MHCTSSEADLDVATISLSGRVAALGPAPSPPTTKEPASPSLARAASPPQKYLQTSHRSPLSPERARVAAGDPPRERGIAVAAGFKSPPRLQLLQNPIAPASPKKITDFTTKNYSLKHVVRLQSLARRWLVLCAKRKKGTAFELSGYGYLLVL